MVARHGELSVLFFYYKVVERFLLWKLIAQTESLVIHAEADDDVAVGRRLVEVNLQFVVVVAYLRPLAPYGSPCLIKG